MNSTISMHRKDHVAALKLSVKCRFYPTISRKHTLP